METGTHSFHCGLFTAGGMHRKRQANLWLKSSDLAVDLLLDQWFHSANWQDRYFPSNTGEWLRDWGIDLKRMNQDAKARNASSYGPSAIHNWQVIEGRGSSRWC